MGPRKFLLASITTVSVLLYMFPHASSESVALPPESAYGPAAESPDAGARDLSPVPPPMVFDVDDYGASAGGDATEAFLAAWKDACNSSSDPSLLLVPEGKAYLLMPVSFTGPCRATTITAMIRGTLEAPSNRSVWLGGDRERWITFEDVDSLHVMGGGTLNGHGQEWWINSCKVNKSMKCVAGPTALYFRSCDHLVVDDLEVKDSMQMHVVIANCWKAAVSRLFVTAPGWSPNTDGIHVSNSREVSITNCIISTGDDCISIVSGSEFVWASGIYCGPGHGISIGSLGANKSRAHVSDVLVEKATLVGTTNGVRIKTWQGGEGSAERIIFQDIKMYNVTNPIIIDQNYCDSKKPCSEEESAVAISDIRYNNIHGTSSSKVAVKFICSSAVHCDGIVMQDVSLVGQKGAYLKCSSVNARVITPGFNYPYCTADM
ncbi:polygalacturonase-like [Triticum urartu]|uniref:polygalacturonase-like n=1 Tax=Triticum urartu TaxID=4572 RepID=UPI002044CA6F|nr:polygalacturonase-like [Triticum urartu]